MDNDEAMTYWQRVRDAVPLGYEVEHNRMAYGMEVHNRLYGICAHARTCLLTSIGWLHPRPSPDEIGPFVCSDPPTTSASL